MHTRRIRHGSLVLTCLVEGYVSEPKNGREKAEDLVLLSRGDTNNVHGVHHILEILGIIHPINMEASSLRSVDIGVGTMNLEIGWIERKKLLVRQIGEEERERESILLNF